MQERKMEEIRQKAVEIISQYPNGVRMVDLKKAVAGVFTGKYKPSQVDNAIWNIADTRSNEVQKISRGIVATIVKPNMNSASTSPSVQPPPTIVTSKRPIEKEFYDELAKYLRATLEEVTLVIKLGNSYFRSKWATPDVIGIYAPKTRAKYQFPMEIVSAEIKISKDNDSCITAFGQASAYKLFSHKVYLVLPEFTGNEKDDYERIEALCRVTGIGLITFDKTNASDPKFMLRVWAVKGEPDKFYANLALENEKCNALFPN